jgi:hypothetical protein
MGERGEKEIAEVVADKAAPSLEAILEEAAEQGFILRKSDHAVADVAWREDAIFPAEAAGAAAVVGDGDDGGEVGDGPLCRCMPVVAAYDVLLEAAEKRGETCTAAESDDAEAVGETIRFCVALPQGLTSFSE